MNYKKPVIFISNFHPFTTRNVFDTGVLEKIAKNSDKVITLVSKQKESYMKELYEKGNVIVHGFDDSIVFTPIEFFFYRFGEILLDTQTKRDHQLKYLKASTKSYKKLKYHLNLFIIKTLGHSVFTKKLFRFLESF